MNSDLFSLLGTASQVVKRPLDSRIQIIHELAKLSVFSAYVLSSLSST